MEGPAFHRTEFEHRSLVGVQLVEPCREKRLDGRRDLDRVAARVADEGKHLLEEEWIPLGDVDDPVPELVLHVPELREECLGLRGVKRLEQNSGRIPLATAPGGAPIAPAAPPAPGGEPMAPTAPPAPGGAPMAPASST